MTQTPQFVGVTSIVEYCGLLIDRLRAGAAAQEIPVIGEWHGQVARLSVLLDTPIAWRAQPGSPPSGADAALPTLYGFYCAALGILPPAGTAIGGSAEQLLRHEGFGLAENGVTVALSEEVAPLALHHALRRRAPCFVVEAPADVTDIARRFPGRSITVVASSTDLTRAAYLEISTGLHRLAPLGWFLADSLGVLSWQIAKAHLYSQLPPQPREHLVLLPLLDRYGPCGNESVRILQSNQVTVEVLDDLTERMRASVSIYSHGDEADAFLRSGLLCSRVRSSYKRLREQHEGGGMLRCMSEATCYKQESTRHLTGEAPDRLVPADEVAAQVLVLNACTRILLAQQGRYINEASVLARAMEGLVGAVVASERVRTASPLENLVAGALLSSGESLGSVVWSLNRLQAGLFDVAPAFTLLGDPEFRLAQSDVDDSPFIVDESRRGLLLRAERCEPGIWPVRVPRQMAIDKLRECEVLEGASGTTLAMECFACAVPTGTREGTTVVVISEDAFQAGVRIGFSTASSELAMTSDEVRLIQARLGQMSCFKPPVKMSDAELQAVVFYSGEYLEVEAWPALRPNRSALTRRLGGQLLESIRVLQKQLAEVVLEHCAAAPGGLLLNTEDPGIIEGQAVTTSHACGACGLPVCVQTLRHRYIPTFERTLHFCYRCGLTADVDPSDGTGTFVIGVPPSVRLGGSLHVAISMPSLLEGRVAVTVGAALLGTTGRTRPATGELTGAAGHDQVELRIDCPSELTPGVYYLKIVLVANMAVSFFNRTVYLLAQAPAPVDQPGT